MMIPGLRTRFEWIFTLLQEPSLLKTLILAEHCNDATEIMKTSGLSHATVLNALYKLENMQLITRLKSGRRVIIKHTDEGSFIAGQFDDMIEYHSSHEQIKNITEVPKDGTKQNSSGKTTAKHTNTTNTSTGTNKIKRP